MGIPIYMRIQQFILDKIKSGEWAPGATIPTEAELGRQFGCSRVTVAMALRELVTELRDDPSRLLRPVEERPLPETAK